MTFIQVQKWILKPGVFLLCLCPVSLLGWDAYTDNLSANPIDDITDATGTWTLRFLMITLAITPLRSITAWHWLSRFRRMAGLFAFFYGLLHFTTYIYLDQFLDIDSILKDIAKRPFITMGFAAFTMLVPLAATSFDAVIRWMGGKNWKWLHRLVYISAICGVIHYLWLVKADTSRPLTYGAVLAVLLGYRIWEWAKKKSKK
jgi:sulfoxide reductase heme-binding subunit YedZ